MDAFLCIVTVNFRPLDDERFSSDRRLRAANTMFDFAIGGKYVSNKPAMQHTICFKNTSAEPVDCAMLRRL